LASSSAEERPMPRLEPVMTATWPDRSNGVFFIFFVLPDSRQRHVMRGLDPPIHLFKRMDCRVKPGNDN
jgi:hypothetical protein